MRHGGTKGAVAVARLMMREATARLVVLLVAGSGLVLASGVPAHACSCAASSTAASVRGADAVFVGTVDEVVQGMTYTHRVPVSSVYEGAVPPVVTVNTAEEGGLPTSCDFQLTPGEELVFFADGAGDSYQMHLCDFSRPPTAKLLREVAALTTTSPVVYTSAQVAEADPAAGGQPADEDRFAASSPFPEGVSAPEDRTDGLGGWQLAGLGLLALGAVAAAAVIARRARRTP